MKLIMIARDGTRQQVFIHPCAHCSIPIYIEVDEGHEDFHLSMVPNYGTRLSHLACAEGRK